MNKWVVREAFPHVCRVLSAAPGPSVENTNDGTQLLPAPQGAGDGDTELSLTLGRREAIPRLCCSPGHTAVAVESVSLRPSHQCPPHLHHSTQGGRTGRGTRPGTATVTVHPEALLRQDPPPREAPSRACRLQGLLPRGFTWHSRYHLVPSPHHMITITVLGGLQSYRSCCSNQV